MVTCMLYGDKRLTLRTVGAHAAGGTVVRAEAGDAVTLHVGVTVARRGAVDAVVARRTLLVAVLAMETWFAPTPSVLQHKHDMHV